MKIRTQEDLVDYLDSDFSWRRKELTQIYANIQSAREKQLNTHLRVGIVMLYAHWEGFIKNAAEAYLTYVSYKRLRYSELSNNFVALCIKDKLRLFQESNKNTVHTEIVEFLLGDLTQQSNVPSKDVINTASNLNTNILKEILSTIGIDYTPYELKNNYIDYHLLNNRNNIAHGQTVDITLDDFHELYKEITMMMDNIKTDILNSAVLSKYKKIS